MLNIDPKANKDTHDMSKLYLIRHGQASFGSSNYDQLSDLGTQQSTWLGEYFKELAVSPTRIIRGDLQRHKQTANAIVDGLGCNITQEENADWNEFDFHMIGRSYLANHPDRMPEPGDVKGFFSILRKGLLAWSKNELSGDIPETWQQFETRVRSVLALATNQSSGETVFVVSSGGTISMTLQILMQFSPETTIDLNLQTRNTGLSEVFFNAERAYVSSFNTVPHLAAKARKKAITSA